LGEGQRPCAVLKHLERGCKLCGELHCINVVDGGVPYCDEHRRGRTASARRTGHKKVQAFRDMILWRDPQCMLHFPLHRPLRAGRSHPAGRRRRRRLARESARSDYRRVIDPTREHANGSELLERDRRPATVLWVSVATGGLLIVIALCVKVRTYARDVSRGTAVCSPNQSSASSQDHCLSDTNTCHASYPR